MTAEDPFLAALAEHWEELLDLATDGQRRRLLELATATGDPSDLRQSLADEILDVAPPGHPVVEALRGGVMLAGTDVLPVDVHRAGLARLRTVSLRIDGPAPGPSPDGSRERFRQRVRERLLALPSEVVDPGDPGLIRLAAPDGRVRLPGFQFGLGGRPLPVVVEVNEILDAAGDPWGVACWWADRHAVLDRSPMDLVQTEPDSVRAAAHAEAED